MADVSDFKKRTAKSLLVGLRNLAIHIAIAVFDNGVFDGLNSANSSVQTS